MEFGTKSRSSSLIINIFEIVDLDPQLYLGSRFGLIIAMCLIFMKFGTYNKLNMLIMNVSIGVDYLTRKLEI